MFKQKVRFTTEVAVFPSTFTKDFFNDVISL